MWNYLVNLSKCVKTFQKLNAMLQSWFWFFFSYVNKNASFQKSLQEFFFKRSKKFYLVYQILAAVMDYYADWNLPPWLWLKQMYVTVKLLFSIV